MTRYPHLNEITSFLNKLRIYFLRGYNTIPPQASSTPWEKNAFKVFLKNKNIQLVFAQFGPTGVAVMDACSEMNIPLVTHFHGFDAYNADTLAKYRSSYLKLFKTSAAIIAVSKDMEKRLLVLGADPLRLHYSPCGVDVNLFKPNNPASTAPRFLAVGRLVEKKAPHLTIQAFSKILDNVPNAKLVLIGDGPMKGICQRLIQQLEITQSVELKGACSHKDVAEQMQLARAFVQHSLIASNGDSEGTPVAILEAGASGLPVISTRHGGIIDVVVENKTGLLVDEGDIDRMSEHMLLLAKNSILATQLGNAARIRISSEFSMDKSIKNLEKLINNLIG